MRHPIKIRRKDLFDPNVVQPNEANIILVLPSSKRYRRPELTPAFYSPSTVVSYEFWLVDDMHKLKREEIAGWIPLPILIED